jgi:methylated-DNA-protein-cysteine methyltransferase related protein
MTFSHGALPSATEGPRARILAAVARIPRGKVATYGQIAVLAGFAGHARQVGYALHALPEGADLPWHRVIGAAGRISFGRESLEWSVQRALLEAEGVEVSPGGAILLEKYQWRPAGVRHRSAGRKSLRGGPRS